MANNQNLWTPGQDRIIMRYKSPRAAYKAIRGKHPLGSVVQRRYQLRHAETLITTRKPGERRIWAHQEEKLLRELWPTAGTANAIASHFPRFTISQIRNKAHTMHLKKKYMGEAYVPTEGHRTLVDQIRIRAKEDGFTFKALDKELGTENYFTHSSALGHRRKIDLWAGEGGSVLWRNACD